MVSVCGDPGMRLPPKIRLQPCAALGGLHRP